VKNFLFISTTKKLQTLLVDSWMFYSNLVYGTPPLRTVFAFDYLHLKAINHFVSEYLSSMPHGQRILDVGCGDERYRKFLPKGVAYVGLDYGPTRQKFYGKTMKPDILGDAQTIPIKSNIFDCILCTEVLEHISDTARSLTEMARVVKPDGQMILTVPFLFPEHNSPYDLHRYTLHGIKYECQRAGIRVVKIVKLGGAGTMLAGLLARLSHSLATATPFGKLLFYFPGFLIFPFVHLLFNMVGYLLDCAPSSSFYIGVGLICTKNGNDIRSNRNETNST